MSDKIADFERINGPRVQRALDQLTFIEKSALSMKIDPEAFQKLIEPVRHRVRQDKEPVRFADQNPNPQQLPKATPPVAREIEQLSHLSTQQLVDRMIACGAELATRRQ